MITLFLANAWGWIVAHKRFVLIAIGIIVLFFLLVFAYKGCSKREVKIDLESIEKINKANEVERKQELQKVVEENADVIRTVDNRSAIAETNTVERNREIDERIRAAEKAVIEAKQQGRDVTQEELKCLLIPENCS